jgi:thiol-disulfide isomerase/thioredoxin
MLLAEKRPFLGQVRLAGSMPDRPRAVPRFLSGGAPAVLTDATFSQALAAPMAIVDFWSPGCPHCVAFKPIFEDVAAGSDGKILMATLNVDENMPTAGTWKIEGLPTTVFFKDGKEIHRVSGSMEKADFLGEIARTFGGVGGGPAAAAAPASGSPMGGILSGVALAGILGGVVYWISTKA